MLNSQPPAATYECGLLWKQGTYRCNQMTMRSLGWVLVQPDWCLYKRRKFHMMTQAETKWSCKPIYTKDCSTHKTLGEKKGTSTCWCLYFPPLASELQKLKFLWFSATWFVLLWYSSPRNQIYSVLQFRVYFTEENMSTLKLWQSIFSYCKVTQAN